MIGDILIIMDHMKPQQKVILIILNFYGNLGWDILENSNISLFGRRDEHKQTGVNNTYKLNFEQKFNNFNLGISYMNGLRNPNTI